MRKPRDFDSAIRALTDKTKALEENKRRQLGELIVATGADHSLAPYPKVRLGLSAWRPPSSGWTRRQLAPA